MSRKKIIILTTVIILILLLIFSLVCLYLGLSNYDFYEGKRPGDNIGSVWVSDEPHIVFTVDKNQHCVGSVENYEKQVFFTFREPGITFLISEIGKEGGYSNLLFGETKRMNKDSVVIEVGTGKYDDLLFNGKYETITFKRQDSVSNVEEPTTCYFCDKRSKEASNFAS